VLKDENVFDYLHSGWHMWWMAGGWVAGLVLVLLFTRAWVHGTAFQQSQESPETILKRRYAQGEISSEEYNRRLIELRK
jgi:uncharacterized membrane protein